MPDAENPGARQEVDVQRVGRHYRRSELPVIREDTDLDPGARRQVTLAVYGQICDSWRDLHDVRFKLLGLVPALAGVGLVVVVNDSGGWALPNEAIRAAAALFGLVVTMACWSTISATPACTTT